MLLPGTEATGTEATRHRSRQVPKPAGAPKPWGGMNSGILIGFHQ